MTTDLCFTIPPQDAREFAQLPQKTRDRVHWMLQVMRYVAGSAAKVRACEEVANRAEPPMHRNSIYGAWRRFSETGDWRVLIDRRHTSEFWKRDPAKVVSLPHEFIQEWKRMVGGNDRAARPAYRQLILRWKNWRKGDFSQAIPGYATCPEPAPDGRVPRGWTYSNLLNHQPNEVELAAVRKGREAAKALLPGVRTTRVGNYPFAEIQFDDMWHNFLVNVPGQKTACRLLEFGCVDAFSTFIFRPGLKPRIRNMDTGRMQALNERDFHLYVINWLLDYGVHPDGTVFNVENGTAAIRRPFEEKLVQWFGDRLSIVRSGMSGAPALPGGYAERAKGNFKVKPLKEGMGNLIQNSLGHLPGQVGMHRRDTPASLYGREKENELLLAIASAVPALQGKLQLGFLDLAEAVHAVTSTYDLLNCRDDHQIEGWEEAGLVIDQFRFSRHSEDWRPLQDAMQLDDHERQLLALTLKMDPTLKRRQKLSPSECVLAHRTRLIRPPHEAIPDLLGPDYGEVREVRGGVIEFTRPDTGKLRFKAAYQDAGGFRRRLDNGTEVLAHLNPWKPDHLYLSEARTGRFLGLAERDLTPRRGDIEAIQHAHGQAMRDFKDALAEVAAQHGHTRIPQLQANTRALREAARPSARDTALAAADLAAASLLDDQATTEPAPAYQDPAISFDPADLL